MAKIRDHGFEDLIKDLTLLNVDKMTDEMLQAAEPIMIRNLKRRAAAHNYSGEMTESIKSTGVKVRKGTKYLVVRPTGKDAEGVRNMEKMAYLEYGTYKQKATPVLTPATIDSEPEVAETMQKILEKELKGALG